MSKVTITLTGPAGAGKTILARHLAAYLKHEHGFTVTLHDECVMGGPGIESPVPARYGADLPSEFVFNPKIVIRAGEKA